MNSTIQAIVDASLPNRENFMKPNTRALLVVLITMLIIQILILFLGQWLWNLLLPKLLPNTIAKATSIWQIWGLQILIRLIVGN